MKNLTRTCIEFHILQSFPVTCLNRDDVGSPKSAWVGGVSRARVSSQCWKRQVRMTLHEMGFRMGLRTRKVSELMQDACRQAGAGEEQAKACGEMFAALLIKGKPKKETENKKKAAATAETENEKKADDKEGALLFLSEGEIRAFVHYAQELEFDAQKIKLPELQKIAKKTLNPAVDALDIALFGRMVANAPEMNVSGAAAFSHALSTHRVDNELDFFTALADPLPGLADDPGAAHMGTLEYNAATYYRYISLDLGQLAQTLGQDETPASEAQIREAVAAFTKALFLAQPSARQATLSGASPWEYARVLVRQGQRLQAPFETPVQAERNGGFLQPSIAALDKYLDEKKALYGSLFGERLDKQWGKDTDYSIDRLIDDLCAQVA